MRGKEFSLVKLQQIHSCKMLKKPETQSVLRRMTVFTGFLTGSSIVLNPDKN